MLPQPNHIFVEKDLATIRQEVLAPIGAVDHEPVNVAEFAHALLMRIPIGVIQRTDRAYIPTPSPQRRSRDIGRLNYCLGAVAVTSSPLPALLERFSSDQRASFLRF